jgi:excisionase family DNA binding protein
VGVWPGKNPKPISEFSPLAPVLAHMCAACPTISDRYEPLLTPAEAGAYLKVHPKTAIRSARQGVIPALRYGKHWRFRKSDLVAWVDQQIKSPRQPESE